MNIKAPKQTKSKVISRMIACAAIIMTSMFSAAVASAAVVNYDGDEPGGIVLSTGTEANILSGANIGCIAVPDQCAAVTVSGQGAKVNFFGGTVNGDLSWSGGTDPIHEFNFYGGIITGGPAGGADGSGRAIFTFHGTSLSATCPVNVGVIGECTITGTLQDGNAIDYTISGSGTYTVILLAPAIDLALTVTDAPDPVLSGSGPDNLTYTFELENLSPGDASNVSVSVATNLPAGVTITNDSASAGTSFDGSTWSVGSMPFGSGSVSLVLTLTVDATAASCTDCISGTATATADETDTDPGNNTDISSATSIESAADAPTSFMTTIAFTNGYDGTVSVTLTCNNGIPLQQTFDISPTVPVNFKIEVLDFVDPDVNCQITLDAIDDGYVGSGFTANTVATTDACLFSASPQAGEAPFDTTTARANTCEIVAEPMASTFAVSKQWLFEGNNGGGDIDQQASIYVYCSPAATNTGPSFGTVDWTVDPVGDDDFSFSFYPSPNGGATCYAQESGLDSSVESDQGCMSGTAFEVGDGTKGCVITNTVFFEGIPTLSQYGLAILAVLTLGIGLVGFRRFV